MYLQRLLKTLVMSDFQDNCAVRPGLPGHSTTRATGVVYRNKYISGCPVEV